MTMEHLPFEDVQYFLLKMETFQCHVSFQRGKYEKSKASFMLPWERSRMFPIFFKKIEHTPGNFLGILRVFPQEIRDPKKLFWKSVEVEGPPMMGAIHGETAKWMVQQ